MSHTQKIKKINKNSSLCTLVLCVLFHINCSYQIRVNAMIDYNSWHCRQRQSSLSPLATIVVMWYSQWQAKIKSDSPVETAAIQCQHWIYSWQWRFHGDQMILMVSLKRLLVTMAIQLRWYGHLLAIHWRQCCLWWDIRTQWMNWKDKNV